MGMMIENQEIIDLLSDLAKRNGTTMAQVLKDALVAELARFERAEPQPLFPRDRVYHRTYTLR